MQISEIMTPSLESINPYASLKEAASKMESEDIGFLPVLSEGELVGVITDRDITIRAVARGFDPLQTTVEETMTTDVAVLPENCDIEDASELMESRNIRRLVVTGADDTPVGVVSKDKLALYLGVYGMDNGMIRDSTEFQEDFDRPAGTNRLDDVRPGGDGSVPGAMRRARDRE